MDAKPQWVKHFKWTQNISELTILNERKTSID